MYKLLLSIVFVLFVVNIVSAQDDQNPNIEFGTISSDKIWNGVISLKGDILIKNNATLTIQPGTQILCDPMNDENNLGEDSLRIEIICENGSISALGTENKPILFTSSSSDKRKGHWHGIKIREGCTLNFVECIIEYGKNGISLENCSPSIESCTVTKNSDRGIYSNCEISIIDCFLTNNGGEGLYLKDTESLIEKSVISNNKKQGIVFDHSSGTIDDCKIDFNSKDVWGNGGGITAYNKPVTITNSTINNNYGCSASVGNGIFPRLS